jgi:2-polyprenyl-3-methyl-5-hydroxy-6-metoxy-1,4-benzoquinol methylase
MPPIVKAQRNQALYWVLPQHVDNLAECYFYHCMDIPGYGFQKGPWDLRGSFNEYFGGFDVRGKRVLDVGCASGFLSFAAEKAGASEVVSFDMDDARRQHMLPFHNSDYFNNYELWRSRQSAHIKKWHNAYWLAHAAFKSKARVYHGDIYDLPEALGKFDVAIVGAVLEHLSDPIRALASISRLVDHALVINTELIDIEEAIARFAGNADRPEIDYVFWVYSLGTYRQVLRMLGFEIVRTVTKDFIYTVLNGAFPRTAIVAVRR